MRTETALSILSAMITPAILMLACSSLIMTTSSRLGRILERARRLSEEAEVAPAGKKRDLLFSMLLKSTRRAKLLQRSMVLLYLGLGTLMLTSIAIGVAAMSGDGRMPAALVTAGGMLAVGFLLTSSALLILESRIALASVDAEMDYVRNLIHDRA